MRRSLTKFILAIGIASGGPVIAADGPVDLAPIVVQQEQLREELLASPDSFPGLSRSERGELLERQTQLLTLLEGKSTADELGEKERVEAFNSLEWIKSRLADAREARLVCTRERMIGSQRVTRVCRTEAEMEQERANSRDFHDRAARKPGRKNG